MRLEVRRRFYPQRKEDDGRAFYYIDFGSEDHGKPSFRLWIHFSLLKKDEKNNPYIEFPVNARIDDGKSSKTKILRPNKNSWVIPLYVKEGFRGSSSLEVKEKIDKEVSFYEYRSPRGSPGAGEGKLLQIPVILDAITVHWKATGRLYGDPGEGVAIVKKRRLSLFSGRN